MAASEPGRLRRSRRAGVASLAALLLVAATGLGCASARSAEESGGPDRLPPQTLTPPPAPQSVENPTPPPTPPTSTAGLAPAPEPDTRAVDLTVARATRAKDPTLVYIEPAGADPAAPPATLAEAAARERVRRDGEAPPAVVINNKNLSDYAAGGVLTIAEPANTDGAPDTDEAADSPVGPSIEESYWRQRGLEIRRRWRRAVDEIPGLVGRVEELRQQFYSTDDPAYRDGQVKPLWDKALADLEEARYQAARGSEEVLAFLEEGRRAGAQPGWLREGAELEPEPVIEEAEPDASEPQEPEIYEESPPSS